LDGEPLVIGIQPRLPRLLRDNPWFGGTVAAERLAALRISLAVVLLLDILLCYLPLLGDGYGPQSLSSPDVFAERFQAPHVYWSVLRWLPDTWGPPLALGVWGLAALLLLVGYRPQLAATVAWVLAISFWNSNFYLNNAGDRLRHFGLMLLILCPSGAVWSIRRPAGVGRSQPVLVPAWPLGLTLFQLAVCYCSNGFYKLVCPAWQDGTIMAYVFNDVGFARWSLVDWPIPLLAIRLCTWSTLVWELAFPVLILSRRGRFWALVVGAVFHIATGIFLELGLFPLYALSLYLPLVPWERSRWGNNAPQ
jgi:hypothetical protein